MSFIPLRLGGFLISPTVKIIGSSVIEVDLIADLIRIVSVWMPLLNSQLENNEMF